MHHIEDVAVMWCLFVPIVSAAMFIAFLNLEGERLEAISPWPLAVLVALGHFPLALLVIVALALSTEKVYGAALVVLCGVLAVALLGIYILLRTRRAGSKLRLRFVLPPMACVFLSALWYWLVMLVAWLFK